MDYCDADGDGLIGFVEFANFLSWKDMMPISREEERVLTQGQQDGGPLPQDGSRPHPTSELPFSAHTWWGGLLCVSALRPETGSKRTLEGRYLA